MISKELFETVFDGCSFSHVEDSYIIHYSQPCNITEGSWVNSEISIYEFVHLNLKEWAFSKGYNIWSDYIGNVQIQDEKFETVYSTSISDTEINEIIRACEYILKELK